MIKAPLCLIVEGKQLLLEKEASVYQNTSYFVCSQIGCNMDIEMRINIMRKALNMHAL